MALTKEERARFLHNANAVLDKASKEFNATLATQIADLVRAIETGDLDETLTQSYHIKATAGGFGWPLLSSAAGLLHLLADRPAGEPVHWILLHQFIVPLKALTQEKFKGEHQDGVAMIKELYAKLEANDMLAR